MNVFSISFPVHLIIYSGLEYCFWFGSPLASSFQMKKDLKKIQKREIVIE